jgi:hypothetical protein
MMLSELLRPTLDRRRGCGCGCGDPELLDELLDIDSCTTSPFVVDPGGLRREQEVGQAERRGKVRRATNCVDALSPGEKEEEKQ